MRQFPILRHLRGNRIDFTLAPIFKFLEAIGELIAPLVAANMIDIGIREHNTTYLYHAAIFLLILAVFGLICALSCQYLSARVAHGFGRRLRRTLLDHICHLSFADFDTLGEATLLTRLCNDTNTIQNGVNMFLRLMTRCPFLILGAIILAMRIDGQLSCIFILLIPLIGGLLYGVGRTTTRLYQENGATLDTITRKSRETLKGVRPIRAFGRQAREEKAFGETCQTYARRTVKVGKFASLLGAGSFLILNLGIVAVLFFGAKRVGDGAMTQGELTAFVGYLTQIALSMVRLSELTSSLSGAIAASRRVASVLAVNRRCDNGTKSVNIKRDVPTVAFRNVTFAYPHSGAASLTDINFTLPMGNVLWITGRTSSGKTTLLSLLARFYTPTTGTVYLYGEDITTYTEESLRRTIATVPQKNVLFRGTIRENLQFARPDIISEKEMWWALSIAAAADFVRLRGLDSLLEENGGTLSSGQRARLCLARGILRRAPILCLDDCLRALDNATIAAILKAMVREIPDVTRVIVWSRDNSLTQSGQSLRLEEGRITPLGDFYA